VSRFGALVWLTVISFAFAKGLVLAHSKPPRLPKTHSDIGRMKGGEYTLDDKSLNFELCKVICICSKVQSGRGDRVSLAKCSMQALRQLRQQTNCLALALTSVRTFDLRLREISSMDASLHLHHSCVFICKKDRVDVSVAAIRDSRLASQERACMGYAWFGNRR